MKGMIIMIGGLWLKVPCKLFNDERLTRSDIAVFAYAADKLKDRTDTLPVSQIASACEVSKSTVIRALDKLISYGYMAADKRQGKPTLYTQLLLPPERKRSKKEEKPAFDASEYEFVINNFGEEAEAL